MLGDNPSPAFGSDENYVRVVETTKQDQVSFKYQTHKRGRVDTKRTARKTLDELLQRAAAARVGYLNDPEQLEELQRVVRNLAEAVLPAGGLLKFAHGGTKRSAGRIAMDVTGTYAAQIPWEAFAEHLSYCGSCQLYYAGANDRCVSCHQDLSDKHALLSTSVGLVHVGPHSGPDAEHSGSRFVMIFGAGDDIDKKDYRDRHARIEASLLKYGYSVEVWQGQQATPEELLHLLSSDRNLAGLYFFGHAEVHQDEARLRLFERELEDGGKEVLTLRASEIRAANPRVPFVYLNACEAAACAEDGLAGAFAGKDKLVIAPTVKISAAEATELAAQFFELATSQPEPTLSGSWRAAAAKLQHVNGRASTPNFNAFRISTMPTIGAFRLIDGGLDGGVKALPTPENRAVVPFRDERLELGSLEDELAHIFRRTPMSEALSVQALAGHMVCSAPLSLYLKTELVLQQENIKLGKSQHEDSSPSIRADRLSPELRDCVVRAARAAEAHHETRITERRLLEEMLRDGWEDDDVDLRSVDLHARLRRTLERPEELVDPQGYVNLSLLDPDARRILVTACSGNPAQHALALFQALVGSRCGERYPELRRLLSPLPKPELRMREQRIAAHQAQTLVLPLLRQVRATHLSPIDSHQLFTLFCRAHLEGAHESIRRHWHIELSDYGCACVGEQRELSDLDFDVSELVDSLNEGTQAVLLRFAKLAHELHSASNRLVLAAFLDQEHAFTAAPLRHLDPVSRKSLGRYLIAQSTWRVYSKETPRDSHREQIVTRLKELASLAEPGMDPSAFLAKFSQVAPTQFKLGVQRLCEQRFRTFDVSWFVGTPR